MSKRLSPRGLLGNGRKLPEEAAVGVEVVAKGRAKARQQVVVMVEGRVVLLIVMLRRVRATTVPLQVPKAIRPRRINSTTINNNRVKSTTVVEDEVTIAVVGDEEVEARQKSRHDDERKGNIEQSCFWWPIDITSISVTLIYLLMQLPSITEAFAFV